MGIRFEISSDALAAIARGAVAAHPLEACGLLFGTATRIERADITANVAGEPATRFEIDPAALFAAIRAERAGGAVLLGYWHSHPSGEAAPSPTDAAQAAPDGKLWLIAGGGEVTAWRAGENGHYGRFTPVTLEPDAGGTNRPPTSFGTHNQ